MDAAAQATQPTPPAVPTAAPLMLLGTPEPASNNLQPCRPAAGCTTTGAEPRDFIVIGPYKLSTGALLTTATTLGGVFLGVYLAARRR